jgi:glycerophosphoryl diester phosphodiesterase/predicted amidohydrolase
MKVCIVQPPYSTDHAQSEKYFAWEMDAFDRCDSSMDLIVFPEAADIPCMAHSHEDVLDSVGKYFDKIYEKASQTAKRCNSIVVFNGHYMTERGHYNSTFVFDRSGNEVGKYFKQHLTPKEVAVYKAVGDYSFEYTKPTVVELEGLRFCFLTCYDFYFYEYFPVLARQKPDIIIGCSHQRSDMHSALETINSFAAYHTNAYVVRASVSMGEDSPTGGGSCVVAPTGKILLNMKSRVGLETVDIDPNEKYYKPAGFGNPPAAHYEYIEAGRRPWKYRPAGSAIVKYDALMPYPRTCAHRGFNTVAPENSMPAFGAAVDMGAEEIELDLWYTADGEIVSIHDDCLDRVSNGSGKVYEHTLAELKKLDFGSKFSDTFAGLGMLTFEELLSKLTCRVVMNVHVKTVSNDVSYDPELLDKIIGLIRQYDCERWVYITSGNDNLIRQVKSSYPHIRCCVGGGNEPDRVVERAIDMKCEKVQFVKPHLSAEKVALAHSHGIACNVFWADDPEECREFLEMGVDTILTNDYFKISQIVKEYKGEQK